MRSLIIALCVALIAGCATKKKEIPTDPKTGKPAWTPVYDPTGRMGGPGPDTIANRMWSTQVRAWRAITDWF